MSCVDGSRVASGDLKFRQLVGYSLVSGLLMRPFSRPLALMVRALLDQEIARTVQPNQSCETTGTTPGKSANAAGSAFNPDGKAGTHYAGEKPQNSRNTASVSQHDVACAHQPH